MDSNLGPKSVNYRRIGVRLSDLTTLRSDIVLLQFPINKNEVSVVCFSCDVVDHEVHNYRKRK